MPLKEHIEESLHVIERIGKAIFPILLSHHPFCDFYKDDIIELRTIKFCKGCIFSYGIFFVVLTIYFFIMNIINISNTISYLIILLGVILGSSQLLRAFSYFNGKILRTIQKIMLGIGLSSILIGVMELNISSIWKIFSLVILWILYGCIISIIRPFYFKRICKKCEWDGEWEKCPGFKKMFAKMENNEMDISK